MASDTSVDIDGEFEDLISREFPGLTGRQTPQHLSVFDGDHTDGDRAIELARRLRSRPFPWQRDCIRDVMSRRPDGTWTHPDAVIVCPRQNGKSEVLIVRILFGILKLDETVIFTAQRWTTAEDIYLRTLTLIERSASFRRLVSKKTCSQGRGVIKLSTGGQVVFTTRSADAGRGLTKIDLVIYDEAYSLTDGEMSALSPAQLAAADPQTIYTSSAVNQDIHKDGLVLASIRERGRDGESDLYFAEFCAPPGMDRDSEEAWAAANPSYGVIQNATKVRKLMRGFSTAAGRKSFDVEILGWGDWPSTDEVDELDPIFDLDAWKAQQVTELPKTGHSAIVIEMTPDRSHAYIAGAVRTGGKIHLELGLVAKPGPRVLNAAIGLIGRWDPVALVIESYSPAASMLPELRTRGIEPESANAQKLAQAFGGLEDAIEAGTVTHSGDPLIIEAIETAHKRVFQGGGWAADRMKSDLAAVIIAIALAHWALRTFDVKKRASASPVHVPSGSTARNETSGLLSAGF